MAIRQYIGARYVTKIYENSLDPSSAEWEAGTTYEPLTLVTYNNGSYLSKKEVPGAIGDPASNPSYWVQTGAYNGQIASLQAQIDTINNTDLPALDAKIDTKELKQSERNYILIFDSYGGLGVSTIAAQACPGGCHVLNVGGAGFVAAGGGQTWLDALTAYVSGLSADDKAAVTDVMVFGGVNDFNETAADITTAMGQFDTYVKTNLINAKISLAPISWPIRQDSTPVLYVSTVCANYSKNSTELGWDYAFGLSAFIHNDVLMESDGIHPTATGATALGHAVKDFILTGRIPELTTSNVDATLAPATGIDSLTGSQFTTMITNNRVRVSCNIVANASTPVTVQSGFANSLQLATMTNSYLFGNIFYGRPANVVSVPAYIHDTGSGTWVLKPVTIQVYFDRMYLSVEGGAITFDAIQTTQFTIESDLMMG